MSNDLPDFTGKIVLVGFRGTTERSYAYLNSPRFTMHDGRIFLVGSDVSSGKFTTGVPWDSVTYYTMADSMEAFRAGTKQDAKPD